MKNCNEQSQEYIANFLTDFLKTFKATADCFNLPTINEAVKGKNKIFWGEKELKKQADIVKNYNNNNKASYMVRGRKRTFFR